ncbi:MAG: MFS transporter [Pseudomonadota bacterium]|nr:MFS transporter [Pseudomonadota bacterium]
MPLYRVSVTSRSLVMVGWFFCALFFFYAFILRVAPAVMVDDLMKEFSVGAAILGYLSATYLYIYAALQIPLGLVVDKYGLRGVVAGACALCGIGSIIFSLADSLYLAYLGRGLVGAGAAFSFVGALNMAARWFPSRFALLGGWAQMMGSAGGFVGQAPLSLAVATFGWRSCNLSLGIAGLFLAVLLLFTVKDPKEDQASEDNFSIWLGLKNVCANKQTWLATLAAAGLTSALLAFGGLWGVPYLMKARAIDKPDAASFISIIFVGWAIGAPFFGWLSDRIRRRRILLQWGTCGAALTTGITILVPTLSTTLLLVVLFLQGFFSASMILGFALAKDNNPPESSGVALGLINTFVVGSGAILQPLVGVLLDYRWTGEMFDGVRVFNLVDFQVSMLILPFVCLISFASAFYIREPQ